MGSESIKRRLRAGLESFDREISDLIERYSRRELKLETYFECRAKLESEKHKKVLENLRLLRFRGHSPKSGTLSM